MTTIDTTSGPAIAESLLHGIGNENWQAATHLLGAHRDGYWLRRFLAEEPAVLSGLWGSSQLVASTDADAPSIDWEAVGARLAANAGNWPKASSSESAVLQVAASLMGKWTVDLLRVVHVLDDVELRLVLRALAEVGNVNISTT
ncbi:hypothetical protein AB0E67_27265 [Streptomyces sp. NPDC032161]|uniref:hypothetical protein n=1 Tax=unclassified Streptomyces TaxID=2593676 RepID=UPI0033C071C6